MFVSPPPLNAVIIYGPRVTYTSRDHHHLTTINHVMPLVSSAPCNPASVNYRCSVHARVYTWVHVYPSVSYKDIATHTVYRHVYL